MVRLARHARSRRRDSRHAPGDASVNRCPWMRPKQTPMKGECADYADGRSGPRCHPPHASLRHCRQWPRTGDAAHFAVGARPAASLARGTQAPRPPASALRRCGVHMRPVVLRIFRAAMGNKGGGGAVTVSGRGDSLFCVQILSDSRSRTYSTNEDSNPRSGPQVRLYWPSWGIYLAAQNPFVESCGDHA